MLLKLTHTTDLHYSGLISESIMEVRMAPRQEEDQHADEKLGRPRHFGFSAPLPPALAPSAVTSTLSGGPSGFVAPRART